MKPLPGSLWSLLALAGAVLVNGCSPEGGPAPNGNAQGKPGPGQGAAPPGPAGQASAGAIQNVRQAAKRVGDSNELHNFALAYTQYALVNGQGPSQIQDIRDSLTPKMVKAFQPDGDYVVHWGIKNPSASSILAYAKDPDVYGTRLVAKGDGTVLRMSKEEWERAQSRR